MCFWLCIDIHCYWCNFTPCTLTRFNVLLVGIANKMEQKVHICTSVWIAQNTMESRVPWLNVCAKILLVCTFSLGSLDSVVSWAIHILVCVHFADLLGIPTIITFWKCFCIDYVSQMVICIYIYTHLNFDFHSCIVSGEVY